MRMQSSLELSSTDLAILEHGQPLRVRVNDDQEVILLLAEQYERLKQFIDFADTDPKALYPLIADVSPADCEDLSAYPNAEKL
jgi:hypothetical protein